MDRRDIVSSLKPVDTTSLFEGLDYSSLQPVPIAQAAEPQTFQLPAGMGSGRAAYLEALERAGQLAEPAPRNVLPVFQPPEAEPGRSGIFDIPVLGPVLDVLDTPRAAIVSTIQEVGDIFGDGDASLSQWWSQTRNHISAQEVLRDWNVDLPGPLDFVVGLGLDIALDPLTYAFGAGVALRSLRSGEQLIDTALDAARVAEAAGDAGKAARLRNVSETIRQNPAGGVLMAAGREPQLLRELGVDVGLRFSRPGTGRLGRAIIDRPLGAISQTYKARAAARRTSQLPQFAVDANTRIRRPLNMADAETQALITARQMGEEVGDEAIEIAAQMAGRMPVQSKLLTGERASDVTARALGLLASPFGTGSKRVAQASWFAGKVDQATGRASGGLSSKFNSQASINAAKRGEDANVAYVARTVERIGRTANIDAGLWNKQTMDELDQLVRDFKASRFEPEDLNELMFEVATTPNDQLLANPAFSRFVGPDGQLDPMVQKAKKWWESAGKRAGFTQDGELEDLLYAARMRDDIRAGRKNPDVINVFREDGEGILLSGNPLTGRHLLEPKIIVERMRRYRQGLLTGTTDEQALAFADDVQRLERKAAAQLDDGVSRAAPEFEEQFEIALRAELEDGVRYGDKKTNVMTNVYAEEALQDVSEAGSILTQMDEIAKRQGVDFSSFKFTDDASAVLPRYVALMTSGIRTRSVLGQSVEAGLLLPNSRFAKSRLVEDMERLFAQSDNLDEQFDLARQQIIGMGADPDTDEIVNILANLAGDARIPPEQVADWLKTAEGQIASEFARLEYQSGLMTEILNASVNGQFYSGLSDEAKLLLTQHGFRDVGESGVLTKTERNALAKIQSSTDNRLAAIADATEYVHEMAVVLGKLQTQRNQLAAALKQLESGAMRRPQTIERTFAELGRELASLQQSLRFLSETIGDNLKAFDPTLLAGRGLQRLADPDLLRKTQDELAETALAAGASAETVLTVARTYGDLPANGKLVQFKYQGPNKGWEVRWNSQPLSGQGNRTTLRTFLGEERSDALFQVLKQLDNSPAGQAQAALLESIENIRILQNRLPNIVGDNALLSQVEQSLDDLDALSFLVAREGQSDYEVALNAMLDRRMGAGLARQPAKTREFLDNTVGEAKAIIDAQNQATVDALVKIGQNVTDIGHRRALIAAELADANHRAHELAKRVMNGDLPNPSNDFQGSVRAALELADSPEAALRAVASGQGNAAFVDAYMEGFEQFMGDQLLYSYRNVNSDFFSPTVSNLTKSKLQRYSFVAPVAGVGTTQPVTKEVAAQMAREFSEMFEAVARTTDPVQLSAWAKKVNRIANWWKAGAVGTPGFVMRNMIGAAWMNNQLAGVPLSQMVRVKMIRDQAAAAAKKAGQEGNIAAGLEILVNSGKGIKLTGPGSTLAGGKTVSAKELETFQSWYSTGMASGTGGRGIDIVSELDRPGSVIEGQGFTSGFKAGSLKPTSDFKWFTAIRGWNGDVEFMARGSLAHHVAMGGGSLEDAATQVMKYHFDYSDLTAFEQQAKQFIPFYTWQRRIVPVLVESIGTNPTAWNRITQLKANVELQSEAEGVVPEYFGENMDIRLPFNIGGYRSYALPQLPFTDLANWAKGLDASNVPEGASPIDRALNLGRPVIESALPFYKYPIESLMDTKTFNQVPFRDTYEAAPEWARMPIISQALQFAGIGERSRSGEWMMTDRQRYQVEQFIPTFAQWSRLRPADVPEWRQSDAAKQIGTLLSITAGIGLRVNTPKEKRNEMLRRQYRESEDMANRRAIAFG
jgi:hypothetical protein